MYSTKFLAAFCLALMPSLSASAADKPPKFTVINKGVPFPEGPIFKGDTLYYIGYGGGGVFAWDGKENKVIFNEKGCGPNSVTSFKDDLLVACYDSNSLVRITTEGKVVGRVDKDMDGEKIVGPNDFAADGDNGVFVTGSGPWEEDGIAGKVFRVDWDLKVHQLADDIHYSNGIVLTDAGKKLLVAESYSYRIISFNVAADGTLSDRRVFIRLKKIDPEAGDDATPDGIKIGPDGNIWIAEYSKPRIAVVSPDGKTFIRGYDLPSKACPNLAFPAKGNYFVATCVDDTSGAPWPGTVFKVDIN